MEKKAMVNVITEDAVNITATLESFIGTTAEWKVAVYELFRYQMTWSFAHRIDVRENRHGVFVNLLVKPDYEKNVLATMESLGFRNVAASHEDIGWIECTDLPEDMLLDYVYIDY